MKHALATGLILFLLTAPAHAQLRKCTGPDGKVTYSDVLCNTASTKTSQTLEAPIPGTQPPQSNVYGRELTRKIVEYLQRGDFDHADTLATTAEHRQMISDARQARLESEEAKKAAKRAARPTVCGTSGYIGPGGVYSGTTVCGK